MDFNNEPTNMARKHECDWTSKPAYPSITEGCLDSMGLRLNEHQHDGVYKLAKKLNVGQNYMDRIMQNVNPGKELLKIWSEKPDTTVYVLYRFLKDMDRNDVMTILERDMEDECDLTIAVRYEHGESGSVNRVFHHNARGSDTLDEVFGAIPELANARITKFPMQMPPQDLQNARAQTFKGRQIQLTVCTCRPHTMPNLETLHMAPNPRRNQSMPPIQETHTFSEDLLTKDVPELVQRHGNKSQHLRLRSAQHRATSNRESDDSGRSSTPSGRWSLESVNSTTSFNYPDDTSSSEAASTATRSSGDSGSFDIDLHTDDSMPRDIAQTGVKTNLDIPCCNSTPLSDDEIACKLYPYFKKNGNFFVRKSRSVENAFCISVVWGEAIVKYRIFEKEVMSAGLKITHFFIFEDTKCFTSIPQLVNYYQSNPLVNEEGQVGPILTNPV